MLPKLLTASAARVPDGIAARCDGSELSYAELDRRTNRYARALLDRGIRRGDRVGIYLGKSLASVVAVFSIMKAGAAYVPLDPKAPLKRLAWICDNCNITVLMTSAQMLRQAKLLRDKSNELSTLMQTDEAETADAETALVRFCDIEEQSSEPLAVDTDDDDLAYILYTSGSTGVPKGVMISHRTIMTFIDWAVAEFGLTEHDRMTSHAPLHFDLSTFDLYATIKAGATIVLVPERLSIFPVELAGLLEQERITVTYMVPSILMMLTSRGDLAGRELECMRLVLFAGEVFPLDGLRQLVAALPHPAYYNLYGPTETNVCTFYRLAATDVDDGATQTIPIGREIDQVHGIVLAQDDAVLTEAGEQGELVICGSCVADGYWGEEAMTRKSFVPCPVDTAGDGRAYRTGDIVFLDENANWRYIGRRDHMVKSRGYRIELGEIEATLNGHEDVDVAVVVTVPDPEIGNRLCAFVVLSQGNDTGATDLRKYCLETLPQYMVPESIRFLDALPVTSSSKTDRMALSRMAESGEP